MDRGKHKAEVWRYDDPGHPDHGTWSWQLIRRPWAEALADPDDDRGNILDVLASDLSYRTWREAFDVARLYVWMYRFSDC